MMKPRLNGAFTALLLAAAVSCGGSGVDRVGTASNTSTSPRSSPTQCKPAVETISVGKHVFDVAIGEGAIWLLVGDDRDFYSVTSVDPNTLKVGSSIPVGDPGTDVFDVTAGMSSVWVPKFGGPGRSQSAPGVVLRIHPETRRVVDEITVGRHPLYAAAGGGRVWVANETDKTVSVIDPIKGVVEDVIQVGGTPGTVRFAEGSVWVELRNRSVDGTTLTRIDVSSRDSEVIMSDRAIHAIADGAIWFSDKDGIGRYDIATKTASANRLHSEVEPSGISAGDSTVWFARLFVEYSTPSGPMEPARQQRHQGGLWRIDPQSFQQTTETIWMPDNDGFPRGWAIGMGALWAPAETNKKLLRVALSC